MAAEDLRSLPESELLSRASLPSLEDSVRMQVRGAGGRALAPARRGASALGRRRAGGVQSAGAPYDHRVGSAVLMQYQLFPECAKDAIILAILAKALSVLPGAEFAQCVGPRALARRE